MAKVQTVSVTVAVVTSTTHLLGHFGGEREGRELGAEHRAQDAIAEIAMVDGVPEKLEQYRLRHLGERAKRVVVGMSDLTDRCRAMSEEGRKSTDESEQNCVPGQDFGLPIVGLLLVNLPW